MRRQEWVKTSVLFLALLVTGCAFGRFLYLEQPEVYRPGTPFRVTFEASPVNVYPNLIQPPAGECTEYLIEPLDTISGTPVVSIEMPDEWELLGCWLSGKTDLTKPEAAAGADIEAVHAAIASVVDVQPGYSIKDVSLPTGDYATVEAFCDILPKGGCTSAELAYQMMFIPYPTGSADDISEEDIVDCEEQYRLWSIEQGLLALRGIDCEPEPVPTVTQWGFLAMALLLAGTGVWFLRRRFGHR